MMNVEGYMIKRISLCCFIFLLFFGFIMQTAADSDFQLDEGYFDNGNHTIIFFSGNLSATDEIKEPLLRGFEQVHIIAAKNDNLIVLFVNEKMEMTLFFYERAYYENFLDGDISEDEFIEYVSTRYIIENQPLTGR